MNIISDGESILEKQIEESLALLQATLGSELLGVYLYGSSLVGGLQRYSDIDLLVVIGRKTSSTEKIALVKGLLPISGIYMQGPKFPLELTLVEQAALNPWHYPPLCDFQYGEWLRGVFEKGALHESEEMPDLAVIVAQVLLKSKTLWGPEPQDLLAPVPYKDFMQAMLHDLDRLVSEIESDTRNVLLTLARIWSTVETDEIRSKPAAADWAIGRLPHTYQPVMERAKGICIGELEEQWDDVKGLIEPTLAFMVEQVRACARGICYDDPSKTIKLPPSTTQ